MCGIAGWLGSLPDGENYTERMVKALHHRGPDGHGIRSWPEATLVHTRLSIIDLSPTGAQPMANEDGTVWTIFNGEIYNHRELRHDLKVRGHVFKGHSDTEVLPHLYEEEGPEFVSKLRGMFALAIYDARTRTLLLARDRFGIKPLFYAPGKDRLSFASEIRPLLELPGIDTRPDKQAIYDFAALFYVPAPETFYVGIRALQPGEMLEARLNIDGVSWKTRTYHSWSISPDPALTLDQATERVDELVTAAVQRQLESDVPLGSLLSGGIDSSLVSVAAQTALSGGLRTFNVRFSEKEYDETWAAVAVAKHIGSRHESLDMDGVRGTWDHVTGLLLHAGQPFADTSLFAVNAICRLMRQHVTVALSGDGGDEGFGGYEHYWQIASIDHLQRLPAPIWRMATVGLLPWVRLGFVRDSLPQRVRDLTGADNTAIIQNLFSWIRQEEQARLCRTTDVLPVRRLFEPQWEHYLPSTASRLERLSAHATEVNTRLVLANDFLFKVDTASMRESLEVRVPMLDEDLFAFGLSLPHYLKVNGRTCKKVLRALAERRLPRAVADKPKWGFGIPVDSWVDGDFKVALSDVLLGPSTGLPEFFRPKAYRPIVEAFCQGDAYPGISRQGLYQRAIMLLSVQLAIDRLKIDCNPLK
ncbi:MAG: asparagine synthase (glutamine-hydrolyzing) [Verrucomicrobia bacterium]|nr:MAG: asparagine synthase (glutamine-hydrolyzing) [Verrucomicrobiota bacterium]